MSIYTHTYTRPSTKLIIVNINSMKTITSDTRTLDFFIYMYISCYICMYPGQRLEV